MLPKAGFLGVSGSVAYLSTITAIDIPNKPVLTKKQNSKKHSYTFPKEWKDVTLEDIFLLEKAKGCKFIFVQSFQNNKNYNAQEWLNTKLKEQPNLEKHFKGQLTVDTWYQKHHCKPGQIVTLEQNQWGSFKPKAKL